jgi:hypothetical protein
VVNSDADNITGQEGDELLGLLDGLPLALAQAAAYMSEKGASFSTYTRLYVELRKWQRGYNLDNIVYSCQGEQ